MKEWFGNEIFALLGCYAA